MSNPAPAKDEFRVDGVHVTNYIPYPQSDYPYSGIPLVFVHGGTHNQVSWKYIAPYLASMGYSTYTFDWYNHGDSHYMPIRKFVTRSVEDVANQELKSVVDHIGEDVFLVGHSMGAMISMLYAMKNPRKVLGLILLAPMLPTQVNAPHSPDVDISVDFDYPFPIPPYDQAYYLFFNTMTEAEAQQAFNTLGYESPRAVREAHHSQMWVNLKTLEDSFKTLVIAAEYDNIFRLQDTSLLAGLLDAKLQVIYGVGHSALLLQNTPTVDNGEGEGEGEEPKPAWSLTADSILSWLEGAEF